MSPLRIAFVSSEVAPLAKTGGLADVSAALPRFLHAGGQDVRVFMPLHGTIDTSGLELHAVDFLRDIPVRFGSRTYTFSGFTTRLPGSDLALYLIHCPELYGRPTLYTQDPDEHLRFGMLSRAVFHCCQHMGWAPDVFHCNDWHAALVPLYLKTVYAWDRLFGPSRTLLTIHNIGYQGVFGAGVAAELGFAGNERLLHQEDLAADKLNFLKSGILYADALTTVSPTYAAEIQTAAYGMGLDPLLRARRASLFGILNGVDYDEWSPERDPYIPVRFSADSLPNKGRNKKQLLGQLDLDYRPGVPVIGIVSRLTHQKGFDLLFDVIPAFLAAHDVRLAVLGNGESKYETFFAELQRGFPGRVCYYRGYSNELAHLIEAGSDMFLMPSRYEPCGLNQMFSLRYGTVPIVRRTGGLADSVDQVDPATGEGTGVVFEHFTTDGLRWALGFAMELWRDRATWRRVMRNGMARDFSWNVQGAKYVALYRRLRGH